MRILHLRVANFYGGPERQLHLHAKAALGSEFDVEVATFGDAEVEPPWLEPLRVDGVTTHVIPNASAYDPSAVPALRALLRSRGIDLLCTHDYRTTLLAPVARHGCRARWIAFSRGSTRDDLKVQAYQIAAAVPLRMARRVVAVSQGQGRKLRRMMIPPRKIAVVHNAVDPALFATTPVEDLRARFGFERDHIVCVAGGRFSAEKGQRVLVDAARLAVDRLPRLRFVLFGDGPDFDAIRSHVRGQGLQEQVRCPGFTTNMVGCIKGADILVNPSLSEGLPNILLEAMAVGTPVVATAVGGVPELVEDGHSGLLVPAGDPVALAAGLVRAADATQASEALSTAARARVVGRFSFEAQFRSLARVYRAALRGSRARGGEA